MTDEYNLTYEEKVTVEKSDALLVVDMQNDFCPGGALAVQDGDVIIPGINELMEKFQKGGAKVVLTQDWHPSNHASFASAYEGKQPFDPIEGVPGIGPILWPDHCVQGTKGAAIHDGINQLQNHLLIRKGYHQEIDSYSVFLENDGKTETGLAGYLKNLDVERVFVCGLALDYCVNFSAQDASMKGFKTYVVLDLTKGIAEDSIREGLAKMKELDVKFIRSATI